MNISFIGAFFWGFFVLASFFGWGYLMTLILRFSKKADLGFQGAFGVCLSVIIGGILNLTGQINRNFILVYIIVGFFILIFSLFINRKIFLQQALYWWNQIKASKFFVGLFIILILIILIRYGSSVGFLSSYNLDDQHGYMVFPAKMLETGSLGNDPFSERRLVSSLGGQYFLDDFILSGANFNNLHLMDKGIGFIIFLFLLAGLIREKKINIGFGLALLMLAAIVPSPSENITSFYTVSILFLAVLRLFWEEEPQKNNFFKILTLVILTATASILKSNFVFPSAVLFAGYFVMELKYSNWRKVGKEFIFASILFFLFLLPWMISVKHSSGTFFYPFFGKGYEGSVYGTFLSHYFEFNLYGFMRLGSEIIFGLGLFMPFIFLVIFWLKAKAGNNKNYAVLSLLSALIGILAMIYGIGGYSLYHYTFAYLLPVILFSIALLFLESNIFGGLWQISGVFLASLVSVFMFGVYIQQSMVLLESIKQAVVAEKYANTDNNSVSALFGAGFVPQVEFEQYKALQSSVPAGEIILARLDRNFLFDFNRNQVYIIDIPGGASPPPGMPSFVGSEKLAQYLAAKGIKYVAYSYGNEARYPRSSVERMLRPHVNPLLRTEVQHSLDFQDNLMDLYKTRKIIYDDGKNFVLDISIKVKK